MFCKSDLETPETVFIIVFSTTFSLIGFMIVVLPVAVFTATGFDTFVEVLVDADEIIESEDAPPILLFSTKTLSSFLLNKLKTEL